jgi:hypothetical protein
MEGADINMSRSCCTGSKTVLFPGLAVTIYSGICRGFKRFRAEGITLIVYTKDTNLFNHLKLQLVRENRVISLRYDRHVEVLVRASTILTPTPAE